MKGKTVYFSVDQIQALDHSIDDSVSQLQFQTGELHKNSLKYTEDDYLDRKKTIAKKILVLKDIKYNKFDGR